MLNKSEKELIRTCFSSLLHNNINRSSYDNRLSQISNISGCLILDTLFCSFWYEKKITLKQKYRYEKLMRKSLENYDFNNIDIISFRGNS